MQGSFNKKGIEGILIKKNDTVHIKKKQNFYQYLSKNLNKNYKNKVSKRLLKIYIMEKIVKEFLENKYVQNFLRQFSIILSYLINKNYKLKKKK